MAIAWLGAVVPGHGQAEPEQPDWSATSTPQATDEPADVTPTEPDTPGVEMAAETNTPSADMPAAVNGATSPAGSLEGVPQESNNFLPVFGDSYGKPFFERQGLRFRVGPVNF
ncbi:MAG: hypothetical protein ACREKL_05205, partial [Chthoniobacterales bacterium]